MSSFMSELSKQYQKVNIAENDLEVFATKGSLKCKFNISIKNGCLSMIMETTDLKRSVDANIASDLFADMGITIECVNNELALKGSKMIYMYSDKVRTVDNMARRYYMLLLLYSGHQDEPSFDEAFVSD